MAVYRIMDDCAWPVQSYFAVEKQRKTVILNRDGEHMKRFLTILVALIILVPHVRADTQPKYIALTFDDGPSGKYTERLLDGLRSRNASATFFLCGYRLERFPELAGRIIREGHEVGSHSDAHQYFTRLSPEALCRDLARAQEKLTGACGEAPTLLRPPGGLFDVKALQKTVCAQMPVILWSVDAEDWRRSDAAGVARDIIRKTRAGDIILMHDMSDSSVTAALTVIDALQVQGFEFVTVSELALLHGVTLEPGKAYYRIPPQSAAKNDSSASREPRSEP